MVTSLESSGSNRVLHLFGRDSSSSELLRSLASVQGDAGQTTLETFPRTPLQLHSEGARKDLVTSLLSGNHIVVVATRSVGSDAKVRAHHSFGQQSGPWVTTSGIRICRNWWTAMFL